MGAYLSEPVTDKESSDGTSDRLSYGASSMQGWRRSQEDAHNCIIDFDKDTSLFAVYDGHGGAEVAKYCAEHLPAFIHSHPEYIKGNFAKTLEYSFLEFDSTLVNPEIIRELTHIAELSEASESDDNTEKLNQEAKMPLEEILARYQGSSVPMKIAPHLQDYHNDNPKSPMLRAKKDAKAKISSSVPDDGHREVDENEVSNAECDNRVPLAEDEAGPCDSVRSSFESRILNGNEDKDYDKQNTCDSTTDDSNLPLHKMHDANQEPFVSGTSEAEVVGSNESQQSDFVAVSSCDNNVSSVGDSEIPESSTCDNSECISNTVEDKGTSSSLVGESSTAADSSSRKRGPSKVDIDSSESSEDDDADYGASGSSSDEEDWQEDNNADEADSNEDGDDDDDDNDDENEGYTIEREEPGSDSGCTAVLALLKEDVLYVANAGDSRCVVSRQGKAVEMSSDHKPEDEPERSRIENAGGEVTPDGRVNGGLNLSRAIGDHAYKRNKELSAREQMITAHPDVRTLKLDTKKDDFMVLACDGIWNYMSSQEVIDFVQQRISTKGIKLSSICEELFVHCLAPSTDGDGTGCDNMTCIIVKFHDLVPQQLSGKRSSPDSEDSEVSESQKRIKIDSCEDGS